MNRTTISHRSASSIPEARASTSSATNEVAYIPRPMRLLEALADAADRVKAALDGRSSEYPQGLECAPSGRLSKGFPV